jgi:hypothetical protein
MNSLGDVTNCIVGPSDPCQENDKFPKWAALPSDSQNGIVIKSPLPLFLLYHPQNIYFVKSLYHIGELISDVVHIFFLHRKYLLITSTLVFN